MSRIGRQIWLFLIALPITYCVIVSAFLAAKPQPGTVSALFFPIAWLIGAFAVHFGLLKVVKQKPAFAARSALLILFFASWAAVLMLMSWVPSV